MWKTCFNQSEIDAIDVVKVDTTINLKGAFCSFNWKKDYEDIKQKLKAEPLETMKNYFGQEVNVVSGDNNLSTCF